MFATNSPVLVLTILIFIAVILILISIFFFYKRIQSLIIDSKKDIREEFRFSLQPKTLQLNTSVVDLVDLALEIWRIGDRIEKVAPELQEVQRKAIESSLGKIRRYLDRYDMEIIDYTGQKYNEGLSLDILSVEKDPTITVPTVKETVEPTILCKGQVVKKAKIILLTN
jgi:Na+/phosphate symporter